MAERPKVVEFKREDWRETADTLRRIADELDSGDLPPCSLATLTLMSDTGDISIFGIGPRSDELQCLAVFRLGEQKMVDVLLARD
ncbi:hypothetical protein [Stutzerimonas nitrititolerans]|uniref:hypothetical protein n=1 Tax=Stutzerimonas nitrititolerans TaxID=2482751 RepID=UPI0028965D82|nr:hypothetical protein [Stutzerimonas nitrititolerans]